MLCTAVPEPDQNQNQNQTRRPQPDPSLVICLRFRLLMDGTVVSVLFSTYEMGYVVHTNTTRTFSTYICCQ